MRGRRHLARRHAGDPLHPVRPPLRDVAAQCLEPGGPGLYEIEVDQPVLDRDMQQAVGERQIRAGGELQMQMRDPGRRGAARIDHDQLAAIGGLRLKILHDRRHGFRRVAAFQQNRRGAGDVRHGEGQAAIDPEGAQAGGGGGGHAEAAVIVDIGGAQGDAREFAEQIGFFIGQPAAAENRHGIAPMSLLDGGDAARHLVQRFIPAGRPEATSTPVAH